MTGKLENIIQAAVGIKVVRQKLWRRGRQVLKRDMISLIAGRTWKARKLSVVRNVTEKVSGDRIEIEGRIKVTKLKDKRSQE